MIFDKRAEEILDFLFLEQNYAIREIVILTFDDCLGSGKSRLSVPNGRQN